MGRMASGTGGLLRAVASSRGFAALICGTAAVLLPVSVQEVKIAYVQPSEANLYPINSDRGAPSLGKLLRGTAAIVQEVRGDFTLVKLQAWVRTSDLDSKRPSGVVEHEPPGEGDASEVPVAERVKRVPLPDPPEEAETRVEQAFRVDLAVQVERSEGEAPVLVIGLALVTYRGRPVHFEGDYEARLTIFEQRRIAGGPVRGRSLHQKLVPLESPTTTVRVPLKELGELEPPQEILVTARVALSKERTLYGSVREIPLSRDDGRDP